MPRNDPLSELEQLVLLALVRLGDDAYGVTIRRAIEDRAGRSVSVTATYAALERLEARGFVSSWVGEPTPVRGGRSRKHFRIERRGAAALKEARTVMARMWKGLERHPDLRTS